jgi:hypothetical protein
MLADDEHVHTMQSGQIEGHGMHRTSATTSQPLNTPRKGTISKNTGDKQGHLLHQNVGDSIATTQEAMQRH